MAPSCEDHALALKVVRQMVAANCPPSLSVFNELLDAFAQLGAKKSALELFKQLQACAHIPQLAVDERAYTTLVECARASDDLELAHSALAQMVADGLTLPTEALNALLRSCSSSDQAKRFVKTATRKSTAGRSRIWGGPESYDRARQVSYSTPHG